jgi:hypothetical protein
MARAFDFDAEITHGALDFGVTQQQLDRPEIPCTTVDEGRFGPAKRMRAEGYPPGGVAAAILLLYERIHVEF